MTTSGWYSTFNGTNYVYARADGTLIKRDWLKLNGNWYWMEDWMNVTDDLAEIDGTRYAFGPDGVMMHDCYLRTPFGEEKGLILSDGSVPTDTWEKYRGAWYLAHDGAALATGEIDVDGTVISAIRTDGWHPISGSNIVIINRTVLWPVTNL